MVTDRPASGDVSPVPWISAIVTGSAGSGPGPGSVPLAVGVGAPTAKSAALSAVLAWSTRATEVALPVPGAGPDPANELALDPQPTRSTTSSASAHAAAEHVSRSVERTSATFAPDPDMATVPVTSGSGSAGSDVFAPTACPTRNDPPAGISPARSVCAPFAHVPVAEAYCTDQPSSETGSSVGLNSSTKSCANAAPLLPPPP